jgi:FkbM family methyltransferase
MDDILLWCHRKLGPVARRVGVQRLARRVYEGIAARRYPPGTLCTAIQNGRTWRLRREVAERGELQEFDTISWLREVLRPGMTVIDVGANVGQMTLEMAALVGPKGRVIAVEPSPGNLEYLHQHVEGNGFGHRVTVIAAACSDEDGGEVSFFVGSEDGVSSVGSGHNIIGAAPIISQSHHLQVRELHVPRVSVDGLCQRLNVQPAVIKIDVEGAELLVVKGAEATLKRSRPRVRVGFHPFAFGDPRIASEQLVSLARRSGYRLADVEPGQTLELEEYDLIPPGGG